ncbi:MAG: RNA polymerase sigma factor [Pirellulales bacterium]|nr:RNA polymerase sigma factor [Pirellulales bacterium]
MQLFNQGVSETAFSRLVEEYGRQVYNIALFTVQNQMLAEDITQEVFIRIHRYLDRFRGEAKLSTWIFRITKNCCLNYLKKEKRCREMGELPEDLPAEDSPDVDIIQAEKRTLVRRAVGKLPYEQRLAIALYYFHERSYTEVATLMELPLNTVKSHLRRAKLALAQMLQCEVQDDASE